MIELIERNEQHNYCLYRSQYIVDNVDSILNDCYVAHRRFQSMFPGRDSTWTYDRYNIFSLTATSSRFYNIYKDLIYCIKDYIGLQGLSDKPMWMQSWMNFHRPNEVLKYHNHNWPFHGYMSIDPKKSRTVFDNFHISNEVGVLYVGEGHKGHSVEVLEPYDGERITIAYDMTLTPNTIGNLSLIPVL